MNQEQVVLHIQQVIDLEYGSSQLAFARANQISPAYVNDVLRGRREPGQKILDVVGIQRVVSYQMLQANP